MLELVDKLAREHALSQDEYAMLIDGRTPALADELAGVRGRLRKRGVCARAHRVHERLQERLLLLRHPAQQPRLRALPPYSRANSGLR